MKTRKDFEEQFRAIRSRIETVKRTRPKWASRWKARAARLVVLARNLVDAEAERRAKLVTP